MLILCWVLNIVQKIQLSLNLKRYPCVAEHKDILSLTHLGKVVSQETKDKLSLATTNYKKNNPLSSEALANIKAKTIEREGVAVSVLNTQTNEVISFPTLTQAVLRRVFRSKKTSYTKRNKYRKSC